MLLTEQLRDKARALYDDYHIEYVGSFGEFGQPAGMDVDRDGSGDGGGEASRPAPPPAAASTALRLRAERCQMSVVDRQLRLRLRGLRSLDQKPAAPRWSGTGTTHLSLDLDQLGQRKERKAADFSSSEIRRQLAAGEVKPRKRLSFEMEWWRRVGLALTPLPLALIGALLGWRLRRSGVLTAFAAAFAVQLLFYYPLFYLGVALALAGSLSPAGGALLPVAGLLLVLAALLPQGRRA